MRVCISKVYAYVPTVEENSLHSEKTSANIFVILSSANSTVCYWTSPVQIGKPSRTGHGVHRYVKLPKGTSKHPPLSNLCCQQILLAHWVHLMPPYWMCLRQWCSRVKTVDHFLLMRQTMNKLFHIIYKTTLTTIFSRGQIQKRYRFAILGMMIYVYTQWQTGDQLAIYIYVPCPRCV